MVAKGERSEYSVVVGMKTEVVAGARKNKSFLLQHSTAQLSPPASSIGLPPSSYTLHKLLSKEKEEGEGVKEAGLQQHHPSGLHVLEPMREEDGVGGMEGEIVRRRAGRPIG